jgi:voltage-gated potassium channel
VREILRAPKVQWRCKECGLTQHETDALHCKHRGRALHMPHDG